MTGQLGFAEAFLAGKAGQNRRLERIAALLNWSPFVALLKPLGWSGGPGREFTAGKECGEPQAGIRRHIEGRDAQSCKQQQPQDCAQPAIAPGREPS